jgi:hypothetical protein
MYVGPFYFHLSFETSTYYFKKFMIISFLRPTRKPSERINHVSQHSYQNRIEKVRLNSMKYIYKLLIFGNVQTLESTKRARKRASKIADCRYNCQQNDATIAQLLGNVSPVISVGQVRLMYFVRTRDNNGRQWSFCTIQKIIRYLNKLIQNEGRIWIGSYFQTNVKQSISIYIKQSRVSYTIYNSRTAGPIFMIFDLLDLSPPRIAE